MDTIIISGIDDKEQILRIKMENRGAEVHTVPAFENVILASALLYVPQAIYLGADSLNFRPESLKRRLRDNPKTEGVRVKLIEGKQPGPFRLPFRIA